MANEISIGIQVTIQEGFFQESINKSFRDDFPIIGLGGGIQIIGTTPENLDFGDVTYHGWLYLENLDENNIIDYGPDDGGGTMVSVARLDPGECCLWRMKPNITVKACARTAASRLLVKCFETATST